MVEKQKNSPNRDNDMKQNGIIKTLFFSDIAGYLRFGGFVLLILSIFSFFMNDEKPLYSAGFMGMAGAVAVFGLMNAYEFKLKTSIFFGFATGLSLGAMIAGFLLD